MSKDKQTQANTQPDEESTEEVSAKGGPASGGEVKDEATINLEGWKKALADYQNLQKETDKRMSQLNDFVLSSLIIELLPIFDNYEIALSHVPAEQKKEAWVQGLEHTFKLWQNFLRDHKVEKIDSVGKNFDPNLHEAVSHVSDEKKADQLVVEEVQSGYMIQQMVIRPAKVIINNIN